MMVIVSRFGATFKGRGCGLKMDTENCSFPSSAMASLMMVTAAQACISPGDKVSDDGTPVAL